MTPLAIAMDIFLAVLLISALAMGVRLNKRLKELKSSYLGFAKAIVELNDAAGRAESGLAALREATSETHDSLLSRIETARNLSGKLEGQIKAARHVAEANETAQAHRHGERYDTEQNGFDADAVPKSLLKLAERLERKEGWQGQEPNRASRREPPAPARTTRPPPTRRRNDFEDELFAPEPRRAAADALLRPVRTNPDPRWASEAPAMTLTDIATPDQALDDFAARIRARRTAV